jgi:ABC-type transport system substrate-binding protein
VSTFRRHAKGIAASTMVFILFLGGCSKAAVTSSTISPTTTTASIVTTTTSVATTTKATTTASTTTPTATKAASTGILRNAAANFGAMSGFDPVINAGGAVAAGIAPIYDFMIARDPQSKLAQGGAIDKWEIAKDGLSWTYSVHKGIKFHNGDDLTAADVKFSLERYMSPQALYPDMRDAIDHVDLVDQYTLRIFTKGIRVYLADLNTFVANKQAIVMPKNYFEKNGADYFSAHPVGSGPYKYVSQVVADSINYEAFDGYWRWVPPFKTVQMVQVPEENTRLAMLQTGQTDVIDVSLDSIPVLQGKGFSSFFVGDLTVPALMLHGAYYPAAQAGPIADIKVRQALSLAINRDEISKTFFYGKAGPPFPGAIPATAASYDDARWSKWVTDNFRYDPAAAKQLLTQAGYANGFNIKIYSYVQSGATFLTKLAEIVQGYWKAVGVNATIVPTDDANFKKIRFGPSPELIGQASLMRAGSNTVATTYFRVWYSNAGNGYRLLASSPTTSGIPAVEPLFDQIDNEPNEAARTALLSNLIQLTADSWVADQICQVPNFYALGPQVAMLPSTPLPSQAFGALIPYVVHSGK